MRIDSMIEFSNNIKINRQVDEVFNFITAFENLPKWNYYVQNVFKTSEGPADTGKVYYQMRKSDEQVFKINEIVKNKKVTVETLPNSTPYFYRKMVFESNNGSTAIEDHWRLDSKVPKVIEKMFAKKIRISIFKNLNNLKVLLEQGKVKLQNGKISTL
jgi:uncharacterized membrane protein